MGIRQQKALLAGLTLFTLSELFPPWQYEYPTFSTKRSAGYHFIFSPPRKSSDEMKEIFKGVDDFPPEPYFTVRIDTLQLLFQRFVLVFLTLGLLVILKDRRSLVSAVLGGLLMCVGLVPVALLLWLEAIS